MREVTSQDYCASQQSGEQKGEKGNEKANSKGKKECGFHEQPMARQNGPVLQTTHYKLQTCTPKTGVGWGTRARKGPGETKDGDMEQPTCL